MIGRSRNAGNAGYNADEDGRQSLYEQYVDVLWRLQPAVAVMENVKGMLSAHRNGDLIFPEVVHRLRHTGAWTDTGCSHWLLGRALDPGTTD